MLRPSTKGWCCMLAALLAGCLISGCSGGHAQWLANDDSLAFDRMIMEARQARVVFLGEVHDQRDHHNLQLKIIKALAQSGARLAIGLEMFDTESQPVLDRWVTGEMDLRSFVASYQQNWTISWAEYDSILLYARNNRIPLIALDAPGEIVTKVSRGGFSSLADADLVRLPAGVNAESSASYRDFVRNIFAGHMLDEMSFSSFCEAQALRNNTMGSLIKDHVTRNSGSSMVIITGIGHAMRRAVADDLEKQVGVKTLVVIPVVEGVFDQISRDDANYFIYP